MIYLIVWILVGAYWMYRIGYVGWIEAKGIDKIIDRIIMFPFLILFAIILLILIYFN